MDIIRAVAPDSGSHVNGTDYHQPDSQGSFRGRQRFGLIAISAEQLPEARSI